MGVQICVFFFLKEEEHSGHWGTKFEVNNLVGNKDLLLSGGEGGSACKAGYLGLFAVPSLRPRGVLRPLPTLPEVGVDTGRVHRWKHVVQGAVT